MFERFSEAAKRVVYFARYEAVQSGAEAIEPEHLLLGILRDGRGRVMEILTKHGITRERVEQDIASRPPAHQSVLSPSEVSVSAETKGVLQRPTSESSSDLLIDTEHILLGILHQERCLAAIVLQKLGLHASEVREHLAECRHDPAWRRRELVEKLGLEKACLDPSLLERLDEAQRQEVEELLSRIRALRTVVANAEKRQGESALLLVVEETKLRERLHRLLVD
jgi:ATP-dependent Clp protease ATP-binding subunit ClpC